MKFYFIQEKNHIFYVTVEIKKVNDPGLLKGKCGVSQILIPHFHSFPKCSVIGQSCCKVVKNLSGSLPKCGRFQCLKTSLITETTK